ncbi:hypothetical protein N7508_001884 [Penicillium antarcticum]|uniref:uncharacterized protein n=1 Tax=Penicillium antarcticum TaxID=416450 RepID=UPI00238C90BD|nr:uncharacterized protein N7508_001884 [Penicillium antarcticum]KAJ5317376.1 hypothetical protein N7508_001884 [Penicillium antarcticum]
MPPNEEHKPFEEMHREATIILPKSRDLDSTEKIESINATRDEWKPTFNRRQSWSSQDQKHQLQERLLGSEQGKEMGFTEAHSGY